MRGQKGAPIAQKIPEVLQTSGMDCGPASLKAFLAGFGVEVSYDRLREACQTDIDGSSIDTLEELAVQLGVDAEQVMLPVDHLLLPEARALPAIVVVRLPGGLAHFVVAWKTRGSRVGIMDPASGRRRVAPEDFLDRVYVHRHPVPARAWRAWAGGDEFLSGLERRLSVLRIGATRRSAFLSQGTAERSWFPLAALDAAVRMTTTIVRSGGRISGREAGALVEAFFEEGLREGPAAIPAKFWFAAPPAGQGSQAEEVVLQGAVLVRGKSTGEEGSQGARRSGGPVSHEGLAELREPPARPARQLWRLLRTDGLATPAALLWALILGGGAVVVEAAVFRGVLELGSLVTAPPERILVLGAILLLLLLLLLLDLPILGTALQMGRKLELRLRVALEEKIPRLEDRYFSSRLISDLAERCHAAHRLRDIPSQIQLLLRASFQFMFTVAGILWLDPSLTPLALVSAGLTAALPMLFRPRLEVQDLRLRTHAGALSRYYFDALLGLLPIRSHGAERALRTEHEGVLREWYRSALDLLRWSVTAEAGQVALGFLLAVSLVALHLTGSDGSPEVLLLIYWALQLPTLGQRVGSAARRLSAMRSITVRLLEPLQGPEAPTGGGKREAPTAEAARRGAALGLRGVAVRLGGQEVLRNLDVDVPGGSHVAVVGPSGAGKSSLMGLILGWHRPAEGEVHLDASPRTPEALESLRSETAWIDPEVQLWNRSLLENLLYGHASGGLADLQGILREADLLSVVARLGDGLATRLGEGGGLVSGGEGQRARLGRAMHRPGARLVILDEAFRGLDRTTRRALVQRARERWRKATLFYVTHDLEVTREFPRVLVLEEGRLVEDGKPVDLLSRDHSRYRALCEAEKAARRELWSAATWKRFWMNEGRLRAGSPDES